VQNRTLSWKVFGIRGFANSRFRLGHAVPRISADFSFQNSLSKPTSKASLPILEAEGIFDINAVIVGCCAGNPIDGDFCMSLAGYTVLITGSIGGIGNATARALAKDGCKVMLHGLEAWSRAVAVNPIAQFILIKSVMTGPPISINGVWLAI
jgi:hypothetical protein